MTDQEILVKAIELAIKSGWSMPWRDHPIKEKLDNITSWYNWPGSRGKDWDNYKLFIFDHEFAKSLWPSTPGKTLTDQFGIGYEPWYFHLQMMVVSDDPIDYLGKNLGE